MENIKTVNECIRQLINVFNVGDGRKEFLKCSVLPSCNIIIVLIDIYGVHNK